MVWGYEVRRFRVFKLSVRVFVTDLSVSRVMLTRAPSSLPVNCTIEDTSHGPTRIRPGLWCGTEQLPFLVMKEPGPSLTVQQVR